MRNITKQSTIEVPAPLFQKWQEFTNEFEDFLLSKDKKFLSKMRQAQKEDVAGKLTELDV